MDNHPIPQDVTNFQFHLIGDLTLKQFGYLIASVILAWIMFVFPIFFPLKFFFSLIFLGVGVLLAFVPLEGRPSDLMLMHFLKALFIPNQYVYQTGIAAKTHIANQPQPKPLPQKKEDGNEKVFLESSFPAGVVPQAQQTPSQPAFVNPTQAPNIPDTPANTKDEAPNVAEEEAHLEEELTEAKAEEATAATGTQEALQAHEKVQQLEAQLHEVFLQKQDLEKQVLDLKAQLVEKQQRAVFTPGTAVETPKETSHVMKIPRQLGKSVGLPFVSDVPNLLTGIVKDSRGNVLPNILIEVKDKDDNAVSAFKTNNLGQFASATPLLNGIYTVSFEDSTGKHMFDTVEMEAIGEIFLPIEVISVDQREKLRQELFGG